MSLNRPLRLAAWALLAIFAGCSAETVDQPAAEATAAAHAVTSVAFVDGYLQGVQLAQQTGKPLAVFFTATWCTYCHQMAAEVLTRPEVLALADRFVWVRVDADREPAIVQQFRVQGFPTVQFVSPRGVQLNRVLGKQPAEQFVAQMQAALQTVARRAQLGPGATVR